MYKCIHMSSTLCRNEIKINIKNIHIFIYTPLFIAALFIVAKIKEMPKFSITDE